MTTSLDSSIRVKNPTPDLDEVLDLLNEIAEDLGCSASPYRGNMTIDGAALQEVIDEMYCHIHEGELEPEPVQVYEPLYPGDAGGSGGHFRLPDMSAYAASAAVYHNPGGNLPSYHGRLKPIDLPDTLETQPSLWKRLNKWLHGKPFEEPTFINGVLQGQDNGPGSSYEKRWGSGASA